jgi:hypothetical protein
MFEIFLKLRNMPSYRFFDNAPLNRLRLFDISTAILAWASCNLRFEEDETANSCSSTGRPTGVISQTIQQIHEANQILGT